MLELEKALQKRCDADKQYETLLAQWTFDKQLVGRALQSIPLIFPHYSLHDASHADTILRQMARVLGPRRIDQLSPTDIWLLLEAAYHHDLGMVVPHPTMRTWWSDKKFGAFLDGLKIHSDDEIRRAAELLGGQSEVRGQGEAWPFDVHRALVLVMAEYARPRHPGQSRKYIDAPSLIDLPSPRTQLVPRRFWSLLGRICESHGLGFAETMKLPARESGFAMDEAHPRFIACMLRLGDLLDLDDGRFCPVLARTFGGLPPSSKVHEEKHHSIEEFLVDASEIRVVAECSSPEAFDITEQWLSWLREELRNQSVHWAAISPMTDFGAVPSAGRIEARLRDYHTFEDGRRPRFEVDKGAMLDFVQGAGLYTDETACIAELLQNAVDATLLRVWGANRRKWQRIHERRDNNALEELRGHLREYPIDVYVKKSKRVGEENHWSVVIRDRGAGISRNDIPFLQCVGSSRKNLRRSERMRGMPEWMKPAGYFGIGLQSVFLFTDRVELRSRADDSMETIEITMQQQEGSKERQILVRTVTGKRALTRPGTRVRFVLREPRIPPRFRYSGGYEETERTARDYDPLLHDELPIKPSKVRDATREFARTALASFRLDNGPIQESHQSTDGPARYFDAEHGVEFTLRACDSGRVLFFYRGRATKEHFSHSFADIRATWHRDQASSILTINREKVRIDAHETVTNGIDKALLNILPRYYEAIKNDPDRVEERRYLALAAEVFSNVRDEAKVPPDDSWKELIYPNCQSSKITFGDIIRTPRVVLIDDLAWSATTMGIRDHIIEWSADRKEVRITGDRINQWLWRLMQNRHMVLQSAERIHETPYFGRSKLVWLALLEEPEDIIGSSEVLKEILRESAGKSPERARRTIPCPRRFRAMAVSRNDESGLSYISRVYARLAPRMLFPFLVDSNEKLSMAGIEELIRWTYEHRLDKATTERDVARAVLDLVQTADKWLREEWGERADYSVDDLRRRLRRKYGPEVLPGSSEGE